MFKIPACQQVKQFGILYFGFRICLGFSAWNLEIGY
jgi:hypothetical protein